MVVTGTRPEIIKLAPLLRRFREDECHFVHSGQHYDRFLAAQFMRELGLMRPSAEFQLQTSDPATQISEMIEHLRKAINDSLPDMVCVEGDTNTVLAASIAALKRKIPLCHVEAGLRSRDWRMPEEHNRILADHVADMLFAPTPISRRNLLDEKVHGTIHLTGNTVIDAVNQNVTIAETKGEMKIPSTEYALTTLHRAENVDDPKVLSSLIESIISIPIQVIFPIHPRTLYNLKKTGLYPKLTRATNVQLLPPVGYFDFLNLMKKCKFIITDSGGIQEEATAPSIRKLVLVLRRSTERPEAVQSGFARVIGTESARISRAVNFTLRNFARLTKALPAKSPYCDGHAAVKIERIIRRFLEKKISP